VTTYDTTGNGDGLRIDDLARLSGTTVDTIRFYQREGLLPPSERQGRAMLYGQEHVERLERIKDLQARHFSLKAIKALAEEGRLSILDRLFGADERTYTRQELVAQAGIDEALVGELEAIGLLGDPQLHGALAYDGDDLAVLSCMQASMGRGMPKAVAVALSRLYFEQMAELQRQLFDIFATGGIGLGPVLSDQDLDAFRTLAANDIDAFLGDSCVLLEYLHRRGVQRLVVQAMALADRVAPGTDGQLASGS